MKILSFFNSSPQINEDAVSVLVKHHFGKKPKKIIPLTGGLANFVYEAHVNGYNLIVRISDVPSKINYYLKEQWAVNHVTQKNVPTPKILEVGNEVIPFPYMIVEKVTGLTASLYPEKKKIITDMGRFAAMINSIETSGYGHIFDWSRNTLSKRESWKDYLEKDLGIDGRVDILERNKMLDERNLVHLKKHIKHILKWDRRPVLTHGDLRLKNIVVDNQGEIAAIIDWENCTSNIAPFWELSIALHDLAIDEKDAFLEGYGIRAKDLREMSVGMKVLNIINYAPVIADLVEKKEWKLIGDYRMRLNGYLDLYSII